MSDQQNIGYCIQSLNLKKNRLLPTWIFPSTIPIVAGVASFWRIISSTSKAVLQNKFKTIIDQ